MELLSFQRNFITSCTGSCHFDNFQRSQLQNFRQTDDVFMPVYVILLFSTPANGDHHRCQCVRHCLYVAVRSARRGRSAHSVQGPQSRGHRCSLPRQRSTTGDILTPPTPVLISTVTGLPNIHHSNGTPWYIYWEHLTFYRVPVTHIWVSKQASDWFRQWFVIYSEYSEIRCHVIT